MSASTVVSPADEAGTNDGAVLSSTSPPGRPPSILSTPSVSVDSNGDQERLSSSPGVAPDSPVSSSPIAAPVSTPDDIETVDRSLDGNGEETMWPQGPDATSSPPGGPERRAASTNVGANSEADSPPEVKQGEQPRSSAPLAQQLTGWAAVEKTLTDYDKQEIGGYKEDIDSLLTFTGLYSAVLTAFVIVSFTQLQEDTAAESLKVLRFIANQTGGGTALGGQLANITTVSTLADPPPFQPTITAIRVNVLWFASLAISVSTASFAILVKQWLREYMSFSSSSPQGQMRVRHLRRSGLQDWYVLGIASMLPLLLQISLALFFVGLCFFTFDIHPTIGKTTITIVCAWAFLFIAVTLSPIFSVRCPYKTPALAPITTALRTHVYAPCTTILPSLISAPLFAIFFLVNMCIPGPVYLIVIAAKAVGVKAPLWHWADPLLNFFGGILDSIKSVANRFRIKFEAKIWDEKEASRNEAKDLIILASADTIQDNPEIDEATIATALDQIQPHWTDATALLVTLIGNRIPLPAFSEGPENTSVDLTALSPKTRGAIQSLFFSHVASRLETLNPSIDSEYSAPNTTPSYTLSFTPNSESFVPSIEPSHLYQSGTWGLFMLFSFQLSPASDLAPPEESIWKHFRDFLLIQLSGYKAYGTGLQLVWCACAYISSRVETHYSFKKDLEKDMGLLQQAIKLSEQKSTTLSRYSSVSYELGILAKRAAQRLMESPDDSRPPHPDWPTSTLYYDAVLLVLKLCGVVYLADYCIDCEELLGDRFRELVWLRTQAGEGHEEMITLCMSLPSKYVRDYLGGGLILDGQRYQEDDRVSIGNAISAIARGAITQDVDLVRILNLSVIALSMEYTQARQWLEQSSAVDTEESSDRLQMFNFLAGALAKARKQNKKNALRAKDNEERDAVGYCWWKIVDKFITAVHADLEGLDLTNFPYFSYFLLELSLLSTRNRAEGLDFLVKYLWQKMQSMPETEKNGIRERGEMYIGRGASRQEESTPANRGILRSIQDVIRRPAWRRSDDLELHFVLGDE